MNASPEGNALTIDGQRQLPLSFPDEKAEQRLRARLKSGEAMSVRIAPTEPSDVQGHALDLTQESVWLNLQLEGDDTEGHAIRVQFPTAADADRFRRNLLAAGILAGSIAIGSAGAIALSSNRAVDMSSDVTAPAITQSQYMAPAQQDFTIPTGINPATDMPWGSGFQERSDGEMSGSGAGGAAAGEATEDEAAPVLQRPEGKGPLETVE
jgi:hypothetical protein